ITHGEARRLKPGDRQSHRRTLNSIEPPWYGPVGPVVWEGRSREAPPYPHQYRHAQRLPSESFTPRTWWTREDPFQEVWPELRDRLERAPGLQAKTLFEDLQGRFPGRFPDSQLRTLQRRIKAWRATEGPPREVFFDQIHSPGELGASDFTCMN